MNRTLLSLIAFVASIGMSYAHPMPRIEVFEYGIYAAPPGLVEGFTTEGLEHLGIEHVELIEKTRTVVAQVGTEFGFRYLLIRIAENEAIPITIVMKFPPPGMSAPGESRRFMRDDYTVVLPAGDDWYEGWWFSDRDYIVPGSWTFEIWCEGKKLAEQTFEVILPPIS